MGRNIKSRLLNQLDAVEMNAKDVAFTVNTLRTDLTSSENWDEYSHALGQLIEALKPIEGMIKEIRK